MTFTKRKKTFGGVVSTVPIKIRFYPILALLTLIAIIGMAIGAHVTGHLQLPKL